MANAFNRHIRRWVFRDDPLVTSKLTLPRKDRGHASSPSLLNRSPDSPLVVYHDVVFSRVAPLDVVQRFFFVYVNQHIAIYSFGYSRAFNLARLKYHIAVRKNYRFSPRSESLKHVERFGVEPISERIIYQE